MSAVSTGSRDDSWVYVMREADDGSGDHDLAWIYLDLTSPLYIYMSVLRNGVRRGKWMHARNLFDDPNVDFIDLRPGKKITQEAGYSHLNTVVRSLVSSLIVDMDMGGTVILERFEPAMFKVRSEQSLRKMATLAFPDATTLW
jgi:hypothetical protein